MDVHDADFDRLDQGPAISLVDSDQFVERMNGINVWKIVITLLITLIVLFFTAGITCGINDQCRNHIPTLHNMLNSTLAAPFVTTGINLLQLMHILLSLALFYMCKEKARYWSILQFLGATLFHLALLLTLFLVTFLSWDRNWANVVAIVMWMLWMLLVMKCLKKYHKYRTHTTEITLLKWNWVLLLFFFLATIVYIVFRALHPTQMDFKGKDSAVLAAEIVGALSAVSFLVLLVYHTRKVTFNMYAAKLHK